MAETSPSHVEGLGASPPARTESRDVNVRAVLALGGGLIVVAVIVHLVSWWVFDSLQAREMQSKRSPSPLAAREQGHLPQEPRLEQIDRMEAKKAGMDQGRLYAEEQRRLETYGWVDEEKKIVRIPIDRAMRVIVEQKRLRARKIEK